jgi:uncharacterized DUF497 family protein
MFAWDETKRRGNLKRHGIDFVDAEKIFRWCRLRIPSKVMTSIRKATKYEARYYFSQIFD